MLGWLRWVNVFANWQGRPMPISRDARLEVQLFNGLLGFYTSK